MFLKNTKKNLTHAFLCDRVGVLSILEGMLKLKSERARATVFPLRSTVSLFYFLIFYTMTEETKDFLYKLEVTWDRCSSGTSALSVFGDKKMIEYANKYSENLLFEAIEIAWRNENISPQSKVPYIGGILRNLSKGDLYQITTKK